MDSQLYFTFKKKKNRGAECSNVYRYLFTKFTPTVFAANLTNDKHRPTENKLKTAQSNKAGTERIFLLLLLFRMAWRRGSNECTIFHCLGRTRAVKGLRRAQCNGREEKTGGLEITHSPACKSGTETIGRCYREGRSKHRDGWRVPGVPGEEWEGARLGIHWTLCAVALVAASPLFSLGWTAGNWVMLPQLLPACARAQGETAARPGGEHAGWCNVDKMEILPSSNCQNRRQGMSV